MRTNAKDELIQAISDKVSTLKCAKITYGYYCDNKEFILPVGFTEEDLGYFLSELDFTYDSGFGGQELYGTVWFTDGCWLSRGEYDGSEWWEYNKYPEIPEECRTIDGSVGEGTLLLA